MSHYDQLVGWCMESVLSWRSDLNSLALEMSICQCVTTELFSPLLVGMETFTTSTSASEEYYPSISPNKSDIFNGHILTLMI